MRHYIIIMTLSLLTSTLVNAQSNLVNEIVRQKSTQRKYLLQQIAALKIYSGYLKQGYNIYKSGHDAISGFKNGELNLHQDYFSSLKNVNSEIARYPRISDIVSMQKKIIRDCSKSLQQVKKDDNISSNETLYIDRVYNRLLEDCAQLSDELIDLITSGKLEMDDDERIQRIDALHEEMKDKYRFALTFTSEIKILSAARKKEQSDIQTMKDLHR